MADDGAKRRTLSALRELTRQTTSNIIATRDENNIFLSIELH